MLETLAQQLQALVAQPVAIVRKAAAAGPYLLVETNTYGDMYSGTTISEHLLLDRLVRPSGQTLRVEFRCSQHELSGQCDEWNVDISGAADAEREPLWELFHPRQQPNQWSTSARRNFRFNGVQVNYG